MLQTFCIHPAQTAYLLKIDFIASSLTLKVFFLKIIAKNTIVYTISTWKSRSARCFVTPSRNGGFFYYLGFSFSDSFIWLLFIGINSSSIVMISSMMKQRARVHSSRCHHHFRLLMSSRRREASSQDQTYWLASQVLSNQVYNQSSNSTAMIFIGSMMA